MNWDDIWKIVLGVLSSIGGIGMIFLGIVKFSSNIIAKRLEEKYTMKLNKELEKYKSNLDNKNYISKTKFDTEFNIYRELSRAFFGMVKDISLMIPSGSSYKIADKDAQREYEFELYNRAKESSVVAQDVLNANAPFIRSDLFDQYNNILNLCKKQLRVFERRWNVLILASQEEKEKFSFEDYERTEEINAKFRELNDIIRKYLATLDVIE